MSYTKGPWEIYAFETGKRNVVFSKHEPSYSVAFTSTEADACLIVKSPKMYEAINAFLLEKALSDHSEGLRPFEKQIMALRESIRGIE